MKRLLLILILTFSFQTWTKADDIRDFQIEGMSIGDSLLDFITKNEIKNSKKATNYKSKKYETAYIKLPQNTYEILKVSYKKKDISYEIHGISGILLFKKSIDECYSKSNKILLEASKVFKNTQNTKNIFPHPVDKSGKTMVTNHKFKLDDGQFGIGCVDYSKKMESKGKIDHLRVALMTSSYNDWLNNEAYK